MLVTKFMEEMDAALNYQYLSLDQRSRIRRVLEDAYRSGYKDCFLQMNGEDISEDFAEDDLSREEERDWED